MTALRTALAARLPQVRLLAAWASAVTATRNSDGAEFAPTGDRAPVLELGACLEAFD